MCHVCLMKLKIIHTIIRFKVTWNSSYSNYLFKTLNISWNQGAPHWICQLILLFLSSRSIQSLTTCHQLLHPGTGFPHWWSGCPQELRPVSQHLPHPLLPMQALSFPPGPPYLSPTTSAHPLPPPHLLTASGPTGTHPSAPFLSQWLFLNLKHSCGHGRTAPPHLQCPSSRTVSLPLWWAHSTDPPPLLYHRVYTAISLNTCFPN